MGHSNRGSLCSLSLGVFLAAVSDTVTSQVCNNAEIELLYKISGVEYSLGSVTVSTDRCQAAAIKPRFFGTTYDIRGSMDAECVSGGIRFSIYSDLDCDDPFYSRTIGIGDDVRAFDFAILRVNSATCDADPCYLSMYAAQNCSLEESSYFLNLSVPMGDCTPITPRVASVVDSLPELPNYIKDELNELQGESLLAQCCEDTGNLLISNFSGLKCDEKSIVNRQMDVSYNDSCFTGASIFDDDDEDSSKDKGVNWPEDLIYFSWRCSPDVTGNCDNALRFSEDQLLDQCELDCDEARSAARKSSNSNSGGTAETVVLVVCLIIAFAFMVGIGGGYYYYRKQKEAEQAERDAQRDDVKYMTMLDDKGQPNKDPHSPNVQEDNHETPLNEGDATTVTVASMEPDRQFEE